MLFARWLHDHKKGSSRNLRTFARKFLLQSDNELPVSEMQKKQLGITNFVSKINSVENYPDFENLAYVI